MAVEAPFGERDGNAGKSGREAAVPASRGSRRLTTMAGLTAALLAVFFPTFASMAGTWMKSGTFVHGAAILPIAAVLAWQRRQAIAGAGPGPSPAGFVVFLLAAMAWFLGAAAYVSVVQQLALIAMIGSAIWFVLGTDVASRLRFPLLFLFFAVPFGESLIPPLMVWTASAAVLLLNLSGVPVILQDFLIVVPGGTFEVIEACSGIRFLIVGVVLAVLFAHLNYESWKKQLAFVAAVAVSVVVVNGLRVYLVILLANATELRIGEDHNLLGWLIFAVTMIAAFWIGSRWTDRPSPVRAENEVRSSAYADPVGAGRYLARSLWIVSVAIAAVSSAHFVHANARVVGSPQALPVLSADWSGPFPTALGYSPDFAAGEAFGGRYSDARGSLELHVVWFAQQDEEQELVGYGNQLFDEDAWQSAGLPMRRPVPGPDGGDFPAGYQEIRNGARQLGLWHWYDIGGSLAAGGIRAKWLQLGQVIGGQPGGDALVVVAVPLRGVSGDAAAARARDFIASVHGPLSDCLRGSASACRVAAAETPR